MYLPNGTGAPRDGNEFSFLNRIHVLCLVRRGWLGLLFQRHEQKEPQAKREVITEFIILKQVLFLQNPR